MQSIGKDMHVLEETWPYAIKSLDKFNFLDVSSERRSNNAHASNDTHHQQVGWLFSDGFLLVCSLTFPECCGGGEYRFAIPICVRTFFGRVIPEHIE